MKLRPAGLVLWGFAGFPLGFTLALNSVAFLVLLWATSMIAAGLGLKAAIR